MLALHVVPTHESEGSGLSYSVPRLCGALAETGVNVELHVCGPRPGGSQHAFKIIEHPYWQGIPGLRASSSMRRALNASARFADVMHAHSIWLMPNIYPGLAVRGTRCRLVTSPRGTLSLWALNRSRMKKLLMWFALQGRATRESACFHATSEMELDEIRALGFRSPIAVVPNGVDLPSDFARPRDAQSPRRLLFLSRIHPKKGVDTLLTAWREVERDFPNWCLSIVGPDIDGYLPKMQDLAMTIGCERVTFEGALIGEKKAAAYRGADLFVLPTRSENFGNVVTEALSYGIPAIVTKGAPWQGLIAHRCGWWIEHGVPPLAESLREALSESPAALRERGLRGRAWVESDFSWRGIGEKMTATYEWLLGGGAPPPWVDLP